MATQTSTPIKNYLSLIKFSHTIFALPFALIGFITALFIADGIFSWSIALLVLGSMVFARSAAMAFNRYIDRDIDAGNPRTATREIPAGVLRSENVLLFTVISSALFMLCAWLINPLCFVLSPIALLVILGYSYTKRFTSLSHFVLGIGLSLAPVGAWLAVTAEFAWVPVLFGLCVLFWVGGFDIIYSLQDREYDSEKGLHSIPSRLGAENALLLSRSVHVLSVVFLLLAGVAGEFGWVFYIGLGLFASLLVYQHTLVRANDLSRVNMAFFTTNGVASVVFAVFVVIDLFLR